jgi:hypothetical protein
VRLERLANVKLTKPVPKSPPPKASTKSSPPTPAEAKTKPKTKPAIGGGEIVNPWE